MTQALLYSINAEHLVNILNGRKTIEVRKRDLPQWAKDKLARGEKVIGYGYCTKGGKRLAYEKQPKHPYYILANSDGVNTANGLVVVKFEVSGSELIDIQKRKRRDVDTATKLADGTTHRLVIDFVIEYKYDNPNEACISDDELHKYGKGKDLYAHHFTNVTPIEPMELRKFYREEYAVMPNGVFPSYQPLTKAPQSFMTVWVKGE